MSAPASALRCKTITVAEASELLGISESTILRAIRAETFPVPFTRIGRTIRVNHQKLLDLIERGAS